METSGEDGASSSANTPPEVATVQGALPALQNPLSLASEGNRRADDWERIRRRVHGMELRLLQWKGGFIEGQLYALLEGASPTGSAGAEAVKPVAGHRREARRA